NGPIVGVWGTIKSELFRGRKKVIFKDKATSIKAINSYIEFFNQERITLKMATLIS
ncbi:IS3 family transposase, partial [Staphylococcus sp. GDY8P218P]|uniref:IS3 family transposase n=1 Tax=Staphylococcus sp. GDY8P218P TaxID=2804178 RepID=UPI001FD9853A